MNRRMLLFIFSALIAGGVAGCSGEQAALENPTAAVAATSAEAQPPTAAVEAAGTSAPAPAELPDMSLHIEAFENGGFIPDRYTCNGANDSPAVSWSGIPPAAQSLVLMVYDADAGVALGAGNELGFLHWMVYDIPPTVSGLTLSATGEAALLAGGIESTNDFFGVAGAMFPGGAAIRGTGYDGPCPPAQHTYVFRLLALGEPIGLPPGTPYPFVMSAAEGRVLAAADYTGVYPPSQ